MKNTPLSRNAHEFSARAIIQSLEELIQQLHVNHTLSQEVIERILAARDAMNRALQKLIEEIESTKRSAQDPEKRRSLEALLQYLLRQWSDGDAPGEAVVDLNAWQGDPEEWIEKELAAMWHLSIHTPEASDVWSEGNLIKPLYLMKSYRWQQKHKLSVHIINGEILACFEKEVVPLPLKPLNAALYTLILLHAPVPIRLGKETLPKYWDVLKELYGYFSRRNAHYQKFVFRIEKQLPNPERWFTLCDKIYKLISEINATIRDTKELPEQIRAKLYIHRTGEYGKRHYYIQLPRKEYRPLEKLREIQQRLSAAPMDI